MTRLLQADYRCLVKIRLTDGTTRLIQNWQYLPLVWKGKNWNYLDFPIPSLTKDIGEDARSAILKLPNIGVAETGYFPIRDWIESGAIANAYFDIFIFVDSKVVTQHVLVVREQEISEADGSQGYINLTLRRPDDRMTLMMTRTLGYKEIGESVRVGLNT